MNLGEGWQGTREAECYNKSLVSQGQMLPGLRHAYMEHLDWDEALSKKFADFILLSDAEPDLSA